MAVIEGGVSAALLGVGAENLSCAHVVRGHIALGSGGAYKLAQQSGSMSASLTNGSEIFQFRYVTAASRLALVYRVQISAALDAAATAVAKVGFGLTVARTWTVAGSSGIRAVLTTNNCKLRTSLSTSEVNDAGISTTGALTAGTKTLDSQSLSLVQFSLLTGAITVSIDGTFQPLVDLFCADNEGGYPLVLANQEGFVIRNQGNNMPTGATWSFCVNVSWLEVPNF